MGFSHSDAFFSSLKALQNVEHLAITEIAVGDVVCHAVDNVHSRGIWAGDDPLSYSLPLLLLQLSIISITTRSMCIFLKPFGQPSIVSQILGGLVLGPSVLGNLSFLHKVFPSEGRNALETLSIFGFMLFIFQIGVKINPLVVLKVGKLALAVGSLGFIIPFGLASCVSLVLCHFLSLDGDMCKLLQRVVGMQSMTAFPVIVIFLAELKILNSEIGRLASSSSMICDICFWSIMLLKSVVHMATSNSLQTLLGFVVSVSLLTVFIVYGIRQAALWAIRHTPEGTPVKDTYIVLALVAVMGCGFVSEVIGVNVLLSSFLVGLVIPDGPPLGAAIVERLDCFVSLLLMPIFFALCGLKTNVFMIKKWDNVGMIQLIIFVSLFGKLTGTILPPLFFRMPIKDAVSLGLIMNTKGLIELIIINLWRKEKVINDECFAIMIISVVVLTGVISPLVKAIYDPSRRFTAYKRRTIRHLQRYEELRILACVHSEENVRAMITLLDASNSTEEYPVRVVILHLIKLAGSANPLLKSLPREISHRNPTQSERIFHAFQRYEQESNNRITFQCYKGISPHSTMHNDVCSLALEQRITFIIIPFYKEPIDEKRPETLHVYRNLNKNVLEKAPCSVGVLIDNGSIRQSQYIVAEYRVVVLFFGGADDREALVYALRMSQHHHVLVTLLHFSKMNTEIVGGTERSKMLNSEILEEFRLNAKHNKHLCYREEVVVGSAGVLAIIDSLKNAYDLVMVGRRHGDSQLMSDLRKSVKQKELGVVGEIIVTEFLKLRASVLVVQQQKKLWGLKDPEESTRLRRVNTDVSTAAMLAVLNV